MMKVFIATCTLLISSQVWCVAQTTEMVLIKAYDDKLNPLPDVSVSINGGTFFSLDRKGSAIRELNSSDLPPKSIDVRNESFEVATWNYSKGKLEVTIRPKQIRVVNVTVRDNRGRPLKNTTVKYSGSSEQTVKTNNQGQCDLKIPTKETPASNHFSVNRFRVASLDERGETYVLTVSPVREMQQQSPSTDQVETIDAASIDSAGTWSEFLALFRNLQFSNVDPTLRQRLNDKFDDLIEQTRAYGHANGELWQTISDSSSINRDIENLILQATAEKRFLEDQFGQVDQGIEILRDKLSSDAESLSDADKSTLLNNISQLEQLLADNTDAFQSNNSYYQQLLGLLKEKYTEVGYLENRLSESELKRIEDRRAFTTRLLLITGVIGIFAVLVVLLVVFYFKLRKVNAQIVHVNENLEHLVRQRTQMLTDANRELDTFLYRASHDLRSPIRSILGLCNIAQQVSKKESQDLLHKVNETVQIMDKLLKKLSMISEINQPNGYGIVHVHPVIADILKEYNHVIVTNGVRVRLNCPEDLTLTSYPHLLHAAVYHVIENALYYSIISDTQSPEMTIEVESEGNNVMITVCDNGVGLEETIKPKVFDMFFKGNENSKGNGLGLYIVSKSVQALGGTISVDSQPGAFTRICMSIPTSLDRRSDQLSEVRVLTLP